MIKSMTSAVEAEVRTCFPEAYKRLSDPANGDRYPFQLYYGPSLGGWYYIGCSDETAHAFGVSHCISCYSLSETIKHEEMRGVPPDRLLTLRRMLEVEQSVPRWCH